MSSASLLSKIVDLFRKIVKQIFCADLAFYGSNMNEIKICNSESENSNLITTLVFGFDRPTTEKSLAFFLQKIAGREMLATLIPRLQDQEIEAVVDIFTGLMKTHLSSKEYHDLFLGNDR
jgi:hypothetical protein